MMVVIDTNVIIDFLEGKEKVVTVLESFPKDEIATTFVNKYELLKYKRSDTIQAAIKNLLVYQSDDEALKAAADAYHKLRSRGITMSDSDLLIFGVCVANDELLITQDKAFGSLQSNLVRIIK